MKLQTKSPALMMTMSFIILAIILLAFSFYKYNGMIQVTQKGLFHFSNESSFHLNSLLKSSISITATLASSPNIENALQQSNNEYATLAEDKRAQIITERNERWMASDEKSPYIMGFLNNSVAYFFKEATICCRGFLRGVFSNESLWNSCRIYRQDHHLCP